MKRVLILLMVIVLTLGVVGCGVTDREPSVDDKQTQQTEALQREMNNQVGMPDISNFYEKKMAKEIYELRDDSELITYVYMQNLDGQFIYLGEAVGFGLLYSTQFSNPERVTTEKYDLGGYHSQAIMPQAEPNGLFTPDGLSATWLIYVNPETGEREIIYSEPSITVTQSKLPKRLVADWSIVGVD